MPVVTYDSDASRNLLMSTGLNPQLLSKNINSWTVRALLMKASGGRVDSSLGGSVKEIMDGLKSVINAEAPINDEDDDKIDLGD